MEKEKLLNPSQAIRQICDILELCEVSEAAIKKIKKLCWNIADYNGGEK